MAMLGTLIFLQALAAVVTLALAIGLFEDYHSWPTETALLFAGALISLVMTFPSHFLTSSEEFTTSPRKTLWTLLAAFIQFAGFGLGLATFVYGLVTNVNGKCKDNHLTFCQVFRITLAFDTLLWLLQLGGFISIILEMRPKKQQALY